MPDKKRLGIGPSIDYPKVDPPPNLDYREPFVVGPPDLAREVFEFNNKYPEARKRVKSVTIGPTRASMELMMLGKLPPGEFERSNILGVYSVPERGGNKEIGLSPRLDRFYNRRDRSFILGHEMGHALGNLDEEGANKFGEDWENYYAYNKKDKRK